ncbi:hypothetical protein J2848_006064 [Azospirillum lipoferum]|uniref:HNH endonuclease n=1 Tax=Azospirillum TaxID=191 RepID=UPI001478E3B8|nr:MULTISPECIES: HNH endonuclease [Azospirillum]MCP1614361.1 hypothetical protein [Azospirillum lipoferum]MDW5531862.1 HNH endonuclease [Azospirillum sp. NL1]
MRYWWVNHSKTYRQEIDGGYIWSPKRESNGTRSQFYDNLRIAAPGEPIISYAKGNIIDIGRVSDFSFTAMKPTEFGGTGKNWNPEGWLLPVSWSRVAKPIRIDSLILGLRPLLPEKYSPFDRTGRGAQKAYLTEISKIAFDFVSSSSGFDKMLENDFINETRSDEFVVKEENKLEHDLECDESLSTTERYQLILARKGQGIFRKNVASIESMCRITALKTPTLLIASHIKPWRLCSNSLERLDGNNGLLLAPHADLLFDRGYISFDNDGTPIFSGKISENDLMLLGLKRTPLAPPLAFSPKQIPYLDYHRSCVFLL